MSTSDGAELRSPRSFQLIAAARRFRAIRRVGARRGARAHQENPLQEKDAAPARGSDRNSRFMAGLSRGFIGSRPERKSFFCGMAPTNLAAGGLLLGERARGAAPRSRVRPAELPIKPSSFANNLRSLDRGKRLGWWRHHRDLLAPPASVLDRTPDELEQFLVEPASGDRARDDEPARIPLAALGRLRSLDPSAEEIPPSFPELVSRPGRWRQTWWTTLDRHACQIAGRWLETRGLAPYLTATSLADARAKLPDEGRVFLELTTRVDADDLVAFAEARELDDLRVCVAAPFSSL